MAIQEKLSGLVSSTMGAVASHKLKEVAETGKKSLELQESETTERLIENAMRNETEMSRIEHAIASKDIDIAKGQEELELLKKGYDPKTGAVNLWLNQNPQSDAEKEDYQKWQRDINEREKRLAADIAANRESKFQVEYKRMQQARYKDRLTKLENTTIDDKYSKLLNDVFKLNEEDGRKN